MGYSSAYWPQDRLFGGLLANGETDSGYDDVSFFSAAHPLNVVRGAARGTYANLFTGTAVSGAPATDLSQALYPGACPIDGTNAPTLQAAHDNLARAVAYVESLKGPHLKPRHLKVRFLMAGTALRKRASEVLSTKYFGTGQGSTENVISTWGVEPLIVPEISSLTDYYLVCEWKKGQGGPMVFQNRRAYVLTSYAPETTLTLQRAKKFEWDYNGRNAVAYGHPYYVFKVKAA